MDFGKRHDTTDTTDFFARAKLLAYRLVADLSFMLRTCYGEVANLLQTCYGKTGVMDFGLNRVKISVGHKT